MHEQFKTENQQLNVSRAAVFVHQWLFVQLCECFYCIHSFLKMNCIRENISTDFSRKKCRSHKLKTFATEMEVILQGANLESQEDHTVDSILKETSKIKEHGHGSETVLFKTTL